MFVYPHRSLRRDPISISLTAELGIPSHHVMANDDSRENQILNQALTLLKQNVAKEGLRKSSIDITEDQAKEVDEFFIQQCMGKPNNADDVLKAGKVCGKLKSSDGEGIGFRVNDAYYEYFIIEKK